MNDFNIDYEDGLTFDLIYCVFCLSGKEEVFQKFLKGLSLQPIPAYTMRTVYKNGKKTTQKRQLIPGYVIFEGPELNDKILWRIQQHSNYLRFMKYTDGSYVLHGSDLDFVKWLKSNNGVIDVSKAYREGDLIKIAEGPLKDYQGQIVSVNNKRKCVAIKLGDGSVFGKIWCSVEMIDKCAQ